VDDEILVKMVKDAGIYYERQLKFEKRGSVRRDKGIE
jgi:hypothetical protein